MSYDLFENSTEYWGAKNDVPKNWVIKCDKKQSIENKTSGTQGWVYKKIRRMREVWCSFHSSWFTLSSNPYLLFIPRLIFLQSTRVDGGFGKSATRAEQPVVGGISLHSHSFFSLSFSSETNITSFRIYFFIKSFSRGITPRWRLAARNNKPYFCLSSPSAKEACTWLVAFRSVARLLHYSSRVFKKRIKKKGSGSIPTATAPWLLFLLFFALLCCTFSDAVKQLPKSRLSHRNVGELD